MMKEFKKTMEALKVVREFCANYYRVKQSELFIS